MTTSRLIYLPLGGAGEIGMNCYVYGYGPKNNERFILIDLGVTFPDMDTTPGVDLILPDIQWLEDRADRLDAIFITHAHEDHVGAVGHLWSRLKAPVYARPFTANIARRKMDEHGIDPDELVIAATWPAQIQAGPFKVGFLPVSHSIPESSAMVIDTPEGRIIHTGDFKLDTNPVVGEPFDPVLWAEVAKGGIKALVCDSTNIFSQHPGRSESSVGPEIEKLIAAAPKMVVATTFASNIARVKTLAEAGERAGRSVVLLGRAMKRMVQAGLESGVLTNFPTTIPPEDARDLARENLLLLVTGSQGERRAASAQLSRGKYLGLEMKEGDLFLFSSKTIPGNERGVLRIVNNFSEMGVDIVDDTAGIYHVSGHANGPDIQTIHDLLNPQIVIPMHGEHRHLREHVKMAEAGGRKGIVATNGSMVNLSGKTPVIAEYIEGGRTYIDGGMQIGAMDGVIRDRIRMALNGHVMATLIIDDEDEVMGDAWCEVMGLSETGRSNAPLVEVLEDEIGQVLARADDKTLADDGKLEEAVRRAVRRMTVEEVGKKAEVTVVISRLVAQ